MTSREFKERLHRRGRKAGVTIPAPLATSLEAYYRLLDLWNQRINLTALPLADAPDQAIDRLLIEPLVAAQHLPAGAPRVLDIGSGGGSPAIPMKLAVPSISLVMIEAKTRKSAFLREAIRHLHLEAADVETARYEELLTRPELHEAVDVVTVRAVRVEMRVLWSLQAFLRGGGRLFLFRGPSGPDVPATLTPPLAWESTHTLADTARLVIVRKQPIAGGTLL